MSEVPKLTPNAEVSDVIVGVNELINEFNFLAKNFSLKENTDGQLLENIVFAAGEDKVIPHKLGKKPKHRLILNQEGNGVLSDTPSGWNQYQIKIKNNGAVSVTATIMLIRE